MPAISDFLENELLDHALGTGSYTAPGTVYIALFTDTATNAEIEQGTLTNEVSGGSYARQSATFDAAASGATQNSADISFTDMPAETVAFVAVMDANTAGNVLFHGPLSANKTLNAGDTFTIATGDLDITLD